MSDNYWDVLMVDDDNASTYMKAYDEGPGCETRHTLGLFINDGESVLDVGCGPMWNYDHFKEYGPDVEYKGTDLSPRFVRVAKERQPEANIELGDCRDIKEANRSWDVVILQDILEHTNGYEQTMSEALRVAKKRVIISFWRMKPDIVSKVNDDTKIGEDGYGAEYNQGEWEEYLDSLPYFWISIESSPKANRWHLFYVVDKEEKHEE